MPTDSGHTRLAGGCACGAVRFTLDGPLRPVIACHCETCRRTSGHYWAATQAWQASLHLVEDRGLKWFRSSTHARRGFCGECGSSLFFEPDGERVSVSAGALDTPTELSLVEHICTAEAGDYYAIDAHVSRQPEARISQQWVFPAGD